MPAGQGGRGIAEDSPPEVGQEMIIETENHGVVLWMDDHDDTVQDDQAHTLTNGLG